MAWREIHMRSSSKEELARKVKKVKELAMEICEDIEEMNDEDFGERGGEWEARGGYGERDDFERMGERRSMRTGRYIR